MPATDGFEELATAIRQTGSLLEMGVAYVRFATTRRSHFEVMWRPDLWHADDPALMAARERSRSHEGRVDG